MHVLPILNNQRDTAQHGRVYSGKDISRPPRLAVPFPGASPTSRSCDTCSCACSPPLFSLQRAGFPRLYSVLPLALSTLKFCVRTECFLVLAVAVSRSVARTCPRRRPFRAFRASPPPNWATRACKGPPPGLGWGSEVCAPSTPWWCPFTCPPPRAEGPRFPHRLALRTGCYLML